jgi:hypothetical protein
MISVKISDKDGNVYNIPNVFCKTWSPIKHILESVETSDEAIPLNVSKENINHLLEWYNHHYTEPQPSIGEAYVKYFDTETNRWDVKKEKNINPFDDDTFDRTNDPVDLENIDDIHQLSRWCLKEYAQMYFNDEWNRNWIATIFKNKVQFFSFMRDVCYLGCQVPLAIGAIALSGFIDTVHKQKQPESVIQDIVEESTNVWVDNLPAVVETVESESESESDSEESDADMESANGS